MVANSPDPAENRRFSAPPAEARPQFEAQAAFNKYSRILWPSGMNAPDFTTVPVSSPDFCTFSAKNAKFSSKIHSRTAPPGLAHPRRVASSSLHPVMRAMPGDNTQLTPEIWKLSGPPLFWNSRSAETQGSGLTDNPLGENRGGRRFNSRGRGFFAICGKSRKKAKFSAEKAQKPPRADPRTLARYLLGKVPSPRGDSVGLFPGSQFIT